MRPHPTSWSSILILSFHLRLGLRSGLFPPGFLTETLYTPLPFPIPATCPTHHTLELITRTVFGVEYTSLSSSLCSFLHSPVTSSFLVPYILLSPLFLRFKLLDSKLEDKAFCTEWYQAFPYSTLLLISSWIEFWFVKFVSIYLKRQRHSMFFLFFFFFVFPWHFAICSDDRAQTLFYVNL